MDALNENLNLESVWKKIERDNSKLGFREGISDGKQENFQGSFNKGYSDGFHNGFLLGKCKGNLKAMDLRNSTCTKEELLQSSRKGSCTICEDNALLEKSIEDIQLFQNHSIEELLKKMDSKYGKGSLE